MRTKVYTNNANCINCKALKMELDSAGVEYDYNVVSYNEIIELANKYNHPSIPICLFDGSVVFGDAKTIVEEIKRLITKPLEK